MIVSIIGVGLIGGSIGLALKKTEKKSAFKIIGVGRNINRLKLAKKLGAVDEITTDLKNGVKDADVIFVCLPVGIIAETIKKIAPFCKKNATITDVGSVKAPIVSKIEKFLTNHCSFIGGHPIAGAEKTSVKYAEKDLFKNATVILTPGDHPDKTALAKIKFLWKRMGGIVKIMSPAKHDSILAETSHLPHIVAFALVNAVNDLNYTGSGFRDMTRIASSDPKMWADIIFNNRTNVRSAIKSFKKELTKIEKAKNLNTFIKIFKKAKEKRDSLLIKNKPLNENELTKFIKTSLNNRRIPPTVREIAKYFQVSISTAHKHLNRLSNKNIIFKRLSQHSNRHVARGIRIIKK